MDAETYRLQVDRLVAETERLADCVDGADPETPVPSCPEWDLGRLLTHIGTGQRWAAAMVEGRTSTWLPFEDVIPDLPADREQLAGWVRDGAARCRHVYLGAEPSTGVWSWTADRTAGFWARRMVHETAVHRADAAGAVGAPVSYEPALAADGVDEWLEILPALAAIEDEVRLLTGDGEVLAFVAPDADASWCVALNRDQFTVARGNATASGLAAAAVTLAAPATDLLLVLYRRAEPSAVEGDRDLLDRWLASTRF